MSDTSTVSMPTIGKYTDVAAYLHYTVKTVYSLVSQQRFAKGIYLGNGRFNMSALKKSIEENGSHLREGWRS